ncbi:MAG: hypothetical protein HXY22_03125 [Alphaproteobacteria bacterium]|nr:hypothetical protein [Alphaproteobacteria bacterium]
MEDFLNLLFGPYGAAAGVALSCLGLRYWQHVQAMEERGRGFEEKLAWLRAGSPFARYRSWLGRALLYLAWFIGDLPDDRRLSPKAFTLSAYWLCVGLAVVYPLVFFTIAWAFFGTPGKIGTVPVFSEDIPVWLRQIAVVAYGMAMIF